MVLGSERAGSQCETGKPYPGRGESSSRCLESFGLWLPGYFRSASCPSVPCGFVPRLSTCFDKSSPRPI
ncbi:hypothetical protein CGCF413_v014235 [Colletotrichum fructicola]|nr:hypothetical protein CGCF413_v014235 [Colletotrichum fructicola]